MCHKLPCEGRKAARQSGPIDEVLHRILAKILPWRFMHLVFWKVLGRVPTGRDMRTQG
jgi:hypothetical protein